MRVEAPVYNYDRPTELVSSNGFSVEYAPIVTDEEIRDDIVSYLGEYRFALSKYDYELTLSMQNGTFKLVDPHRKEPMVQKGVRALVEKQMRDEATHREEAELKGLISLEQQLQAAEVGDSVLWFSPPGPKEEGYGNYGFIFEGEVVAQGEDQKDLKMTAVRVENPTLDQYNQAHNLLIGSDLATEDADVFLASPSVIKGGIDKEHINLVLENIFAFKDDPEKKARFQRAISRVNHLIEEFSKYGRYKPVKERVRMLHAIENLVVEARREDENGEVVVFDSPRNLTEAAATHGFTPEETGGGSCPKKSNNPLSNGIENINSLLENEICSHCGKSSEDNHYHCPRCKIDYKDETDLPPESRTKVCMNKPGENGKACGFEFAC